MTLAKLTNTCPVCGAEESLDNLIYRVIDDDQVRRLVADVLTISLPLGGNVVRYLRLHKPAKQRLRMDKARAILQELVPAITNQRINRHGRDWVCSLDAWRAAFEAVFVRADSGDLRLPLSGNAYLFGVIVNLVDKHEAEAEKSRETQYRSRAHSSANSTHIADITAASIQDRDPVLAQLDADRAQAAPMPAEVKAKLNELKQQSIK